MHFGLTCAGCHTAQYNTVDKAGKKVGIRIDGAGTLGDFEGFLVELVATLVATGADEARFTRFAKIVLGDGWSTTVQASLKKQFDGVTETRLGFNQRTATTVKGGFSRLDAFTGILNQLTEFTLKQPGNHRPALSPVSYPHLWDTPYYDWVEWNGLNSNNGLGPLGRNVGEVMGTFANVEVVLHSGPALLPTGYPSTARMTLAQQLEDEWLRHLQAPPWPTMLWGEIDSTKSAAGALLYESHCVGCHPIVNRATHVQNSPPLEAHRKEAGLSIRAVMVGAESIGTDPAFAGNISSRMSVTGMLQGQKTMGIGGDPKRFGEEAPAASILKHIVASAIADHIGAVIDAQIEAFKHKEGTQGAVPEKYWIPDTKPDNELNAYRARALTGIWATAPYLHNGSVLTLDDLLLPPDQRPKVIHSGSFLYDPVKVGLVNENICPDEWNAAGSAWTGEPEANFGGVAETSKVNAASPDMTKCEALGYAINVDPSVEGNVGNWASGHEAGTSLNAEERGQLIEYIKTL